MITLEYAKQEVAKYNEEYKAEKVSLDVNIDFSKKLASSDNHVAHSKNLNIGYFFIQSIYNDLKIKKFLDDIMKDTKAEYDANLINRFLTISRILDHAQSWAFMIVFIHTMNSHIIFMNHHSDS